MKEWHIAPDYIVNNWDEDLLALLVGKLNERQQREADAIQGRRGNLGTKVVSDVELFSELGGAIKVVKQ